MCPTRIACAGDVFQREEIPPLAQGLEERGGQGETQAGILGQLHVAHPNPLDAPSKRAPTGELLTGAKKSRKVTKKAQHAEASEKVKKPTIEPTRFSKRTTRRPDRYVPETHHPQSSRQNPGKRPKYNEKSARALKIKKEEIDAWEGSLEIEGKEEKEDKSGENQECEVEEKQGEEMENQESKEE